MNRQIDRHVQHARHLRQIHPQKKDVAPPAVAQVHAHGRRLAQNREGIAVAAHEQFRPNAQRIIGGVARAKHPLIASHRPHASPHLVGKRLKREPAIRGGQRAGNAVARSLALLGSEKDPDGLFIPPAQQLFVTMKGDQRFAGRDRVVSCRQVKSMDRVKKKEGPHPLVEVFA